MNIIEALNEPERKRKYLNDNQVKTLLATASVNPKWNFASVFLLQTGLRIHEFCKLKVKDIDLENDVIHVIGKGDKERTVGIPPKLHTLIIKWKVTFMPMPDDNIWTMTINGTERMFTVISKYCGFKVTPHTLRHTFSTRLLNETKDIVAVQTILGHSSINTTGIYAIYNVENAINLQKEHVY